VRALTHVTKVPPKTGMIAAVCLAGLLFASKMSAQISPSATHQTGPAESLYLQLQSVGLDASRVFGVRDASIDRAAIHITLDDGTIAFTQDVLGRITGAFFEGEGELLLAPPTDVERRSMSLFTGMAILEERFSTAYFRFNDDTPAQLQPGFRTAQQPQAFVARWDSTVRNLAREDAMRLLSSFCELLPTASEAASAGSETRKQTDPEDRMLHVRMQGNTLGVFDVFYDSTADEEIEAGQTKTAENGNVYYDVWTSFSTRSTEAPKVLQKKIPETLPRESESRQNRILVHSYVIDARVKPPKELDADVKLQLDVEHGGSRFLAFELSRFLEITRVESDGQPVEFIHNPAVEGSRLARSGDDLVAVILPEPAVKRGRISLHFIYRGDVLAEAARGLLYVGARGTWYPNRGLAMADFDLTFHYPAGWTLVATGKPTPIASASSISPQTAPADANQEQVARWVSERPIPLAGFDLGKYVRVEATAGSVTVEAYATAEMEREFPSPQPSAAPEVNPLHRHPVVELPPLPPTPLPPSPARNEVAVANFTAAAIRFYAARFGPFPYTQLVLAQLPGLESQGWPGLIFLSSYAFLNQEEQADIHMNAVGALIDRLVPAHEAAHQWWGDLVTWSTYHDQWFSEGLANYSALMMLQQKNPTGFRLIMEKYRQEIAEKNENAGPVTLGSRLLSSRFPQGYLAISYGRATWLFHMLRCMLQDGRDKEDRNSANNSDINEPFVRSLRKLRERYAGKSITTRELLDCFAEDLPASLRYEGKASLDWFLDGWVNGTSLPRFELQAVKLSAKGKERIVTGILRQENAPASLVTSVPIYAAVTGRPPIFLSRIFADGTETTFRLSAPAGTHKLLVDPYGTVLTAPKHAD
jgi:Peptidase family M1 domain